MSNILASTTQILDLLVPLEGPDRARVLRAVQAAIDLTVEPPSPFAGIDIPVEKEKPARRAPKAPRKAKTKPASDLESKILEAIRLGNSRPKNIAKTIGTSSQSYQFRRALLKLLESKAVTATGAASGRHYHAGTTS